jgi:hypothetical protein
VKQNPTPAHALAVLLQLACRSLPAQQHQHDNRRISLNNSSWQFLTFVALTGHQTQPDAATITQYTNH